MVDQLVYDRGRFWLYQILTSSPRQSSVLLPHNLSLVSQMSGMGKYSLSFHAM